MQSPGRQVVGVVVTNPLTPRTTRPSSLFRSLLRDTGVRHGGTTDYSDLSVRREGEWPPTRVRETNQRVTQRTQTENNVEKG